MSEEEMDHYAGAFWCGMTPDEAQVAAKRKRLPFRCIADVKKEFSRHQELSDLIDLSTGPDGEIYGHRD